MSPNPDPTVSVLDIMCKDRYAEAEAHKRRRDELSQEARNWALRRDQYRDRSKDALREAKELIPYRDAINVKVKEIKERRDNAHAEAAKLKGKDKEAYQAAREVGNRIHEEMLAEAEKGHALNDKINGLFEESRVDRILAQAAHKKFVQCRKGADEEHRKYMDTTRSMRDMRSEFTGEEEPPGSEFRCPKGEKGREALAHMNEHHAPLADWALAQLPEIAPSKILDIGCGGGMLIGKLHEKYPDARLFGVDISDESVAATRANNKGLKGLKVQKASVSKLPFRDGSFQLITAVETYFFWPDLPNDIRSAVRCLSEGGMMVIVSEAYPHPELDDHSRQNISEYGMNIVENDEMLKMMDEAGLDARFVTLPENSWVTFIGVKRSQEAGVLQQDLQADEDEDDSADELGAPAVPAAEEPSGPDADS